MDDQARPLSRRQVKAGNAMYSSFACYEKAGDITVGDAQSTHRREGEGLATPSFKWLDAVSGLINHVTS